MAPQKRNPRVVIVGAGMSGIAMGVALKGAGFDDFVMLEKGTDVVQSGQPVACSWR